MESSYSPLSGLDRTTDPADLIVLQPPRCSVYPELPADYYCLECHCFVSSHGHVRGAHRNHRFLTIREAAELHVPALRSWADRCEVHLRRAEAVLESLGRASRSLDTALHGEEARLDAAFDAMVASLRRQRDAMKRQLHEQVAAGQAEATQAWRRVDDLVAYYSAYLEHCAALMVNVPPVEAMDTASVLWSADVMRTAELLRSATQVDDVWLPELTVPRVASHCTAEAVDRLLHLEPETFTGDDGATLPAVFDVRPFQFPYLTSSDVGERGEARPQRGAGSSRAKGHSHLVDSFLHSASADAGAGEGRARAPAVLELEVPTSASVAERASVVIFNHNTSLTRTAPKDRSSNEEPSHVLVHCRTVFAEPGLYGWSVRVDMLGRSATGASTGLVLAGLVQPSDLDGDGVVWDGATIAGPRRGQAYAIPAVEQRSGLVPRVGSTMQFVLDLTVPRQHAVLCFLDGRFVCRLALPVGRAWSPAVSVLTHEERVTVSALEPSQTAALHRAAGPGEATAASSDRTPPRRGGGARVGRSGYSPEVREILDYVESLREGMAG